MGISLVGTPTVGSNTNGGGITLSLPSGLAENDVVYVLHQASAISVGSSYSGWTPIYNANATRHIWRKVMGATPDTTLALTVSGTASGATHCNAAIAFAFRGVDTTVPEDALASDDGASTNPDPPSSTPETTGAWALVLAGSRVNDAAITAPSGYSNHTTQNATDTDGSATVAGATKSGLTALVAEDPPSWTNWSNGNWLAQTIILRPAETNYEIDADAGGYVLTGSEATLTGPRFLDADAGSYAITGATADLLRAYAFEASTGLYELTGSTATLTLVPVLRSIATLTVTTSQAITVQTATPILTVQRNQNISVKTATPKIKVQ